MNINFFAVQGEDDAQKVTVGSVVTLKINLTRSPLLDSNKREEEMREINEKVLLILYSWFYLDWRFFFFSSQKKIILVEALCI